MTSHDRAASASKSQSPYSSLSYADRVKNFQNPTAIRLLQLATQKKTNLCLSVDVTSTRLLLDIADAAGPYISCLKTHADIVDDFSLEGTAKPMCELAARHGFIIFEDRKFADIGNTVHLQYSSGPLRISSWADLVTAHSVPGPGILTGLGQTAKPLGRAVVLLAEMSSKGNLCDESYRRRTWEMARDSRDLVLGFIGMERYFEAEEAGGSDTDASPDFLYLTPGVSLESSSDKMGQQYRTPSDVVGKSGCDFIIVGRGIYGGVDSVLADGEMTAEGKRTVAERCEKYKAAGWEAYEQRLR